LAIADYKLLPYYAMPTNSKRIHNERQSSGKHGHMAKP